MKAWEWVVGQLEFLFWRGADICDARPGRFSELAVFDARLYIRVRCIDEPA